MYFSCSSKGLSQDIWVIPNVGYETVYLFNHLPSIPSSGTHCYCSSSASLPYQKNFNIFEMKIQIIYRGDCQILASGMLMAPTDYSLPPPSLTRLGAREWFWPGKCPTLFHGMHFLGKKCVSNLSLSVCKGICGEGHEKAAWGFFPCRKSPIGKWDNFCSQILPRHYLKGYIPPPQQLCQEHDLQV